MTPARRATLWLLAMCAIWGSTFFTMKLGTQGLRTAVGAAAPSAFLFLRFLLAAALFPLLFPRVLRELRPAAAAGGALLSVPFYAGFLLQVTGLESTASTVSAFLTNLTVVLTPLLGFLFFRERLPAANVLGALVALAGVYVLTNPRGGGFGPGERLTTACALAFAFQIQLTGVVTRRHPPEAVTFVMFLCAVAFSGGTLVALGVSPAALARGLAGRHAAWTVVYTATVCSIVAITIMNRYQREIPATRAAVIYTLEPVFAALFASVFVAEEPLTARQFLGGGIILAGNLACELIRRPPSPPPVPGQE
jgi:drug/metabolite transporter (DMT)-like permease